MKYLIFILMAMGLLGEVHAQRLSYSIGVTHDRYKSMNGTMDAVTMVYHPRLHFQLRNDHFVWGLSSAPSLGKSANASWERSKIMILEIPLAAEFGFNHRSFNPKRHFSVFAGGGVSRILLTDHFLKGSNYMNAHVSMRFSVFREVVETRLNYGMNINRNARANKVSLSLAYVLR